MSAVSDVTTKLGRVQLVVGTPPMSPGKCVICGTPGNSESNFIDTGWDIDFYGVVYFCLNCIKEAAAVLDMVPVERYEEVKEQLDQEVFKCEALQSENGVLRNVINRLRDLGFNPSSDLSDSDSSKSDSDEKSGEAKPGSGKSSQAKSRSTKPSNVQGSTDVRVNDSSKDKSGTTIDI